MDPLFAGVPDENAHSGLVQHFAETGSFSGGTRPGYASTEQAGAISASRSDFVTANPLLEPPADRQRYERWLRTPFSAAARGDAAGPNPAATNPRLYYVVAAAPYGLAEGSDFFTRA